MTSDLDIYRTAKLLIDNHGAEAPIHAAMNADAMLASSYSPSTPASSRRRWLSATSSKRGERIYHIPGGAYYDRTKISTAKGERWFCSEEGAQAAGWRRSKR